MTNLERVFAVLEGMPEAEVRLAAGEPPYVVVDGQRRDVGAHPLTFTHVFATAVEVFSQEELRDLPAQRPRVARYEHGLESYVVEAARSGGGFTLAVRLAHKAGEQESVVGETSEAPRVVTRSGEMLSVAHAASRAEDLRVAAGSQRSFATPRLGRDLSPLPPALAATVCAPVERISAARTTPKHIDALLRRMVALEASDLHLCTGNAAVFRVNGDIRFLRDASALASSEIEALVRDIMTPRAAAQFDELRDADFAYEVPGLARFRVNVFVDRLGVGAVLRQIPLEIKTVEELGLPRACVDLCRLSKGLVVVTGPTGSGKSTTLAAMVDHVNKTRFQHVVTIEDPVEFVHPNQRCLVNQREVGQHTKSFKAALRAALREDPDIVMIGEMRDLETVAIAIETAETGHLVFATLHTSTAVSTVDRIIDQFPTDRQAQIRVMLSESLKGVVAQNLCRKIGGGRIAAHEILLGTFAVSALIRDGKTFQIASVMQTSKGQGMQTLNDSLVSLVQRGLVEPKEAWLKAVDKNSLVTMFKNAGLPTAFE